MTDHLNSTLADVAAEFAQRAQTMLLQPRWMKIQSLINQVNEIDAGRYQMIINGINHQNGHASIVIVDLKQNDEDGKPQNTFTMTATPQAYMADKKQSIGFHIYDDAGKRTRSTPSSSSSNEIGFMVSCLSEALPEEVYTAYADRFLSEDGQHPGFDIG